METKVLTVSEVKKFNRRSENPETHEVSNWFQLTATTNETFAGFKKDEEGNKIDADVNTVENNARTWWYAFTNGGDAVIAAYDLLLNGLGLFDTEAGFAIQSLALLNDATIVIENNRYEVGDVVDDVVLDHPIYIRKVVSIIPGIAFMTNLFRTLRSHNMLGLFADEKLSDAQLATKWIMTAKASLESANAVAE